MIYLYLYCFSAYGYEDSVGEESKDDSTKDQKESEDESTKEDELSYER